MAISKKPSGANRLTRILKLLRPQLSIALVIAVLQILAYFSFIPPTSELVSYVKFLFSEYGLPLIAVSSFIENLVGVNVYFPGSIAILAGMALTAGDPSRALLTYFTILAPAFAGNLVCFYLGRRLAKPGSSGMEIRNKHSGFIAFLLTYWHPHLAAMTSFAAGSSDFPFRSFLRHAALASLLWSSFWGITIYNLGKMVPKSGDLIGLFFAYLLAWAAWDIYKARRVISDDESAGVD